MSLQGEWWIDDTGYAQFADGDIGDQNHETIAFWAALGINLDDELVGVYAKERAMESITEHLQETGAAFSPEEIRDSLDYVTPGGLSEEQAIGLLALGADAKAVEFFSGDGGDARDYMMVERAWIRVDDNNFQLWTLDDEALGRIRDFVNNEYPEDEDPLEDEFQIEELRKDGVHLSVSGADLLESGKSADTLKYSAQRERTGMYNPPEFNDAFWCWFGDSKVKKQGVPTVVYHGTGATNVEKFNTHEVWFSEDPNLASAYSGAKSWKKDQLPTIYPVYLSIQNPLKLSVNMNDKMTRRALSLVVGFNWTLPKYENDFVDGVEQIDKVHRYVRSFEFREAAIHNGYDGIRVKEGKSVTWAAFYPEQIKSATGNDGTWDPRDPDITHNPPKVFRVKSTKLFFRPEHDE